VHCFGYFEEPSKDRTSSWAGARWFMPPYSTLLHMDPYKLSSKDPLITMSTCGKLLQIP